MLQEQLTFLVTLGELRHHKTIILLGIDILDKTLLCLEVECHLITLITVATHLKDRSTELRSC